jgi:uncharacterized small protein (DUF1192 family)
MAAFDLLTLIDRAGGITSLARHMNVTVSTLRRWRDRGVPEQWRCVLEESVRSNLLPDEWEKKRQQEFEELVALNGYDFERLRMRTTKVPKPLLTPHWSGYFATLGVNAHLTPRTLIQVENWAKQFPSKFKWWLMTARTSMFGNEEAQFNPNVVGSGWHSRVFVQMPHTKAFDFALEQPIVTKHCRSRQEATKIILKYLRKCLDNCIYVWLHGLKIQHYRRRSKEEVRQWQTRARARRRTHLGIRDLGHKFGISMLAALLGKARSTVSRWLEEGVPKSDWNVALLFEVRRELKAGELEEFSLRALGYKPKVEGWMSGQEAAALTVARYQKAQAEEPYLLQEEIEELEKAKRPAKKASKKASKKVSKSPN